MLRKVGGHWTLVIGPNLTETQKRAREEYKEYKPPPYKYSIWTKILVGLCYFFTFVILGKTFIDNF